MTRRPERVVVFDLDDTLYPEWSYTRSGLAAVARWVKAELGLDRFFELAWQEFERGNRGKVFDAVLAALGRAPDPATVTAMIEVYRRHRPAISLAADAERWLENVSPEIGLALISDGFIAAQSRKVEVLGLAARGFAPIILTDAWGRDYWKPNARAFAQIEQHFALAPGLFAYVADNPLKDFVTPRQRGWQTVQIKRPERIHHFQPPSPGHAAAQEIDSLDQLDAALALPRTAQGTLPA
jgi:putative hydrolase of the HAD superfamily